MNGIRAGKYAVRGLYLIVWVFITLVIVGPAAGFVMPFIAPQYQVGFGVDLSQNTLTPQFQFLSSGSAVGTHTIVVPVYNEWFFPAKASLSFTLITGGSVVYQTQPASIDLPAFSSGKLNIAVQITPGVLSQLQGKRVTIGGQLSIGAPPQLLSFTIKFPQG